MTLPAGDQATTASARDEWEPQVVAAIGPLGRVVRSGPVSMAVEDGGAAVPAVRITLSTS